MSAPVKARTPIPAFVIEREGVTLSIEDRGDEVGIRASKSLFSLERTVNAPIALALLLWLERWRDARVGE